MIPAPFYVSIQSTEGALSVPLGYEPTGHEPIEAAKQRRLSKKDHYRGLPGMILSWKVMDFETWAHLQTVTGGRGVASADGFLRFIDLEDTSGVETWVDYSCVLDKPKGKLSENNPGMIENVTMRIRELQKQQLAS